MTEKEKKFHVLLIDCLLEMKLPEKNIQAIVTMLKTERQMGIMLNWIVNHHKENPTMYQVMMVAVNIKNGVK